MPFLPGALWRSDIPASCCCARALAWAGCNAASPVCPSQLLSTSCTPAIPALATPWRAVPLVQATLAATAATSSEPSTVPAGGGRSPSSFLDRLTDRLRPRRSHFLHLVGFTLFRPPCPQDPGGREGVWPGQILQVLNGEGGVAGDSKPITFPA